MLHVPHELLSRYVLILNKQGIPASHQADYRKWFRYFLDFCDKYPIPEIRQEKLRMFIEKLREKKQTVTQRKHAARAISIYFDMLTEEDQSGEFSESQKNLGQGALKRGSSHYCEAGYNERTDSPEWDKVLHTLAEEIKVRHYSRKTLKTYANWSRRFQRFLKNKPPHELSTADAKEYLTYLAVKCKVAASKIMKQTEGKRLKTEG